MSAADYVRQEGRYLVRRRNDQSGGLSLSATAAWATMLGFPAMNEPAVEYRLGKAVGFLKAVMTSQLAAKSPGASVRWPGRILRGCDSTCTSRRTDWRVHAVYDPGRSGICHGGMIPQSLDSPASGDRSGHRRPHPEPPAGVRTSELRSHCMTQPGSGSLRPHRWSVQRG
jgi:hypothetical protein